jgi:hypothetical protein
MKTFIFLYLGILLFDIIYTFLYDQFLIDIEPDILKYPFAALHILVSIPLVFMNKNLPFYAPIPMYQAIIIFLGNVLVQTFLIYVVFFKKKKLDTSI